MGWIHFLGLRCGRVGRSGSHQLVLQWTLSTLVDFDALVALEDEIIVAVRGVAQVDGHDFGSGEGNIFLYTDAPQATLDVIRAAGLLRDGWRAAYRAGSRPVGQNAYTVLRPPGLTAFSVK